MKSSPLKAFEEFLELTNDRRAIYDLDTESIDETLKPFLANSEKHWEHVKLISEARWAIHIMKRLLKLYPRFLRKKMFSRGKWSKEYYDKVDKLKSKLLQTTEPATLNLDILPSRIIETPQEWKNLEKQIHLIEIKTGIIPNENLLPNSFDLKIDLENEKEIQIIESFPSTDFSEAGNYKIGMSNEGKFITSSNIGGNIKIGAEYQGASVDINAGKSIKSEQTSSNQISYEFQYANKVLKIMSSSVGESALWRLLRTTDHCPIGGLNFFLSILIPNNIDKIKFNAKLSTEIETWGLISNEFSGNIILTKK